MKKIGVALLCMLLLNVSVCLVACGETTGDVSNIGSSMETTVADVAAHVHTWGEWKTTMDATCVQEGEQSRVCACGERETRKTELVDHVAVIDSPVAATCTEEGKTTGSHCEVCHEVLAKQYPIAAKGHTVAYKAGLKETCTETGLTVGSYCSACKVVFEEQTVIPATGHTIVPIQAVAATCTAEGCMEGGAYCSICNEIMVSPITIEKLPHNMDGNKCLDCSYRVINYADPDLYPSTYGYDFLATLEKGEIMQELYRQINDEAYRFHTDTTVSAKLSGNFALLPKVFNHLTLGLTAEEAQMVYDFVQFDHPIYYWMTGYGKAKPNGNFQINSYAAYANGESRASCHLQLCDAIAEYAELAEGETSAYDIALLYHDAIIADTTYGEASVPGAGHRITGQLLEGLTVCEGYSKVFQLLLNLHGVECVYMSGNTPSGGRHAWNVARMDDGNWYWFDLTWNDIGQNHDGIYYPYFCVNDTQIVDWRDIRTGTTTPKYHLKRRF